MASNCNKGTDISESVCSLKIRVESELHCWTYYTQLCERVLGMLQWLGHNKLFSGLKSVLHYNRPATFENVNKLHDFAVRAERNLG